MKIGLLLEGGGLRGMYTAGILDVFIEENIEVDAVVSVSAGALFGVNFVSKQHGRAIRYNLKYAADPRYMGIKSLIKTKNIVNKEFAFYEVPVKLDPFDQDAFGKSQTDFFVTLTNVDSGEAEYVKIENVFKQMEALRATGALPMVSEIVEYTGNNYLDGGVNDPIPIEKILGMDLDKIIVILTRPLGYKKTSKLNFIQKFMYRKYSKFLESWSKRTDRYNNSLSKILELENKGKVFVFRPSENTKVGRLEKDPAKIQEIYDLGKKDALGKIENLKQYLIKE